MRRLRYSVPDEQWALIEEIAEVFSLDPKIILQFSTSIGLRFLDMSVIHPLSTGIGKALDERAQEGAAAITSDLGKAIAQNQDTTQVLSGANVSSRPKSTIQRKKTAKKGK